MVFDGVSVLFSNTYGRLMAARPGCGTTFVITRPGFHSWRSEPKGYFYRGNDHVTTFPVARKGLDCAFGDPADLPSCLCRQRLCGGCPSVHGVEDRYRGHRVDAHLHGF